MSTPNCHQIHIVNILMQRLGNTDFSQFANGLFCFTILNLRVNLLLVINIGIKCTLTGRQHMKYCRCSQERPPEPLNTGRYQPCCPCGPPVKARLNSNQSLVACKPNSTVGPAEQTPAARQDLSPPISWSAADACEDGVSLETQLQTISSSEITCHKAMKGWDSWL